jgi:hypothetical protein
MKAFEHHPIAANIASLHGRRCNPAFVWCNEGKWIAFPGLRRSRNDAIGGAEIVAGSFVTFFQPVDNSEIHNTNN